MTCKRTQQELAGLIRSLKAEGLKHNGPQRAEDIDELENLFNITLPHDYRMFLGNYGALYYAGISLFGLGEKQHTGMTVVEALLHFRFGFPHLSTQLVPVEDLEGGRFACLLTSDSSRDHCPVVAVDITGREHPTPRELASCFRDYAYERLNLTEGTSPDEVGDAWKVFEDHVQRFQDRFQYDHAEGGKLPRNTDWRPYRYCIQDVVFGVTVVRHHRDANCLQADVFLTAHIPEYGSLAGAHALAAFLLSEAYKCGGTMEIRFTRNVEGGQVPQELQELANGYGIQFRRANEGRIEPDEAKALYAALTDFAPKLQQRINELEAAGRIRMARACYVVHHGVWSKEQVEMIVLGSELADMILGGSAQPPQRHLYQHSLLHARAALMGGMLDRILAQRERTSAEGIPYDMEDDVRPLTIQFDGYNYAKRYQCPEPIPVPWLYPDGRERELLPDVPFRVLVRARDAGDLHVHLERDIQQVAQMPAHSSGHPTFVLVPHDFTTLPESFQQQRQEQAKAAAVGLLVCPETTLTFDNDAASKLARSRVLRK